LLILDEILAKVGTHLEKLETKINPLVELSD